jgi:hypothetical protein
MTLLDEMRYATTTGCFCGWDAKADTAVRQASANNIFFMISSVYPTISSGTSKSKLTLK